MIKKILVIVGLLLLTHSPVNAKYGWGTLCSSGQRYSIRAYTAQNYASYGVSGWNKMRNPFTMAGSHNVHSISTAYAGMWVESGWAVDRYDGGNLSAPYPFISVKDAYGYYHEVDLADQAVNTSHRFTVRHVPGSMNWTFYFDDYQYSHYSWMDNLYYYGLATQSQVENCSPWDVAYTRWWDLKWNTAWGELPWSWLGFVDTHPHWDPVYVNTTSWKTRELN